MEEKLPELESKSEESKIEVQPLEVAEKVESIKEPETPQTETKTSEADSDGHISYERWLSLGRDPEEYKGARAYKKDGELFSHIKFLKDQVKSLVDHNKKTEELAYKKAINDLKSLHRRAVEEGDIDTADRVTEQIVETRMKAEHPIGQPTEEAPPEVSMFINKNQNWFNDLNAENVAMKQYAIAKEKELRYNNPDLPIGQVLNLVEKKVREFYPQRFQNEMQKKPAAVSAPSPEAKSSSGKKATGWNDLPENLKQVYQAFKSVEPSISLESMILQWKEQGVL